MFSEPAADCFVGPCGVPTNAPDGANAAASLDIVRFQVAALRASNPDSDGDGVVDTVDVLPEDSGEWADFDGDGIGDNTDSDDDNDGVTDVEDAFPFDAAEWADADGDGIGDNGDEDVVDLGPFRDPALRDAVAEQLGWPDDLPPSEYDLSGLTRLRAAHKGIRDITGLEQATNLRSLDLPGNEIANLSPLAGLDALGYLSVWHNSVADIAPIEGLVDLSGLNLVGNPIADLSPLSALTGLQGLSIGEVSISDLSSLVGEMRELESLELSFTGIDDLSPLAELTSLSRLLLDGNEISDLSPLSALPELVILTLSYNPVTDLSPLADLDIGFLDLSHTRVTLDDVATLPFFGQLDTLILEGLAIDDLSPFAGLRNEGSYTSLHLAGNRIVDLSPLSTARGLFWLDIQNNFVSDIGPLVNRDIWYFPSWDQYPSVALHGNPRASPDFEKDVADLESWGVYVYGRYDRMARVADPALRDLIARQGAGGHVGDPLTERTLARAWRVWAFNAGVSDLAGLETATNLRSLYAGSNSITDLGPLASLDELAEIDLSHNLILDIAPLTTNTGIGEGDRVSLTGNPLTQTSLNTHVPALREAGALVAVDSVAWTVAAGGGKATFDTAGYFASLLGSGVGLEADADDPGGLVSVRVANGVLEVTPGTVKGRLEVTVTATDDAGDTATLAFHIAVAGSRPVPLVPSATDPDRQGFVRVINRSREAGVVRVDATDDDGGRAGPVWLALKAGTAAHFNSTDLENGNPGKGLADMAGQGTGDWRLDIASELDIEVLSYVRTTDGFLTAMHDVAPQRDGVHHVATFNPGSNPDQESLVRLVNPGTENATVTIRGVDDHGASPGSAVEVSVPAGASRTYSAADLEADGLGNGVGKWALTVSADRPIHVMSLLSSPTGHLTNLSTVPAADGGTHAVPLFPSMSDDLNRQGFVRVVNRSEGEAQVTIAAFDETNRDYDPLTLTVGAGRTVHFNSDDLELGNEDKGLSGNTGAGQGHWRLEPTSDADIEVLSYIRTTDGFLTSMHDTVPEAAGTYHVATFNPGRNVNQISRLRLINATEETAQVTISGIDDAGVPSTTVRTSVPAGTVRSFTASELETGTEDLDGALGTGSGKWRLGVESDQPVTILNLLESPTGHLTNLSTVPERSTEAENASGSDAD